MALSMQRAAAAAAAGGVSSHRSVAACRRPVRGLAPLVRCSAVPEVESKTTFVEKLAMPMASVAAATMVLGAIQLASPAEALAARSGGRAGASSFGARRAAPRMSTGRPQVNNYSTTTIVAAPPVYSYSPFGFGGFGFGGFRIMPVFPVPFFGGFLQLMFLMLIVGVVFNVVKGALGGGAKSKSKSQDWDDL